MSEEYGEDYYEKYFDKPSFVIIAIDTHESMFIKQEDEEDQSAFQSVLAACEAVADSLILNTNKRSWSQFAILLANDDDDSKKDLVDFKTNPLESFKALKKINELSNDALKKLYMRKGDLDLSKLFLLCKSKFKEVKYNKRTVIYITNDDNPMANDKEKRFNALKEVKSFDSNEILFQMITMNESFDFNKFYNELFSLQSTPSIEEIAEDVEGLTEKLLNSITVRCSMKKLKFFPFKNNPERHLNVVKKNFIKSQKLYCNEHVQRSTSKIVKKIKKNSDQGGTSALKKFDISSKNVSVIFNELEVAEILESDFNIGLTLVYTSDRITERGFVLKAPSLLEIDNTETGIFEELFNSFWQFCYEKNKVLVCLRKLKKCDKLRFVELIPKFAFNKRVFLIAHIPFQNEIKYPPTDKTDTNPDYTAEQLEAVNNLIDSMTYDYHPTMFANPIYRKKKAYVKAKLLDEPMEEVFDSSLDIEQLNEQIRDVAHNFRVSFNLGAAENVGAKKRKTPAAGGRRGKYAKK